MTKASQRTLAPMLSSDRMDWETPPDLFADLEAEFGPFNLDVCATDLNAKVVPFFSPEDDGLSRDWYGVCWCNPPYGRQIGKWIAKAHEEARAGRATTVMLIPSRTDTAYWHEHVMFASLVRFLRGRVRFLRDGEPGDAAPFPSAVVVFRAEATMNDLDLDKLERLARECHIYELDKSDLVAAFSPEHAAETWQEQVDTPTKTLLSRRPSGPSLTTGCSQYRILSTWVTRTTRTPCTCASLALRSRQPTTLSNGGS